MVVNLVEQVGMEQGFAALFLQWALAGPSLLTVTGLTV